MSLRSIVTATTSIAIAIALAVLVPIAQLQIADDQPTCCCPNPKICKCNNDHQGDSTTPSMRACHKTPQDLVRAELPQFVRPAVIEAERSEQPIVVATLALPLPHPTPHLPRPDGPS